MKKLFFTSAAVVLLFSAAGWAVFARQAATSDARESVCFRVENAVFIQGNDQALKSETIFHNGVAYDFSKESGRVTIFDTIDGRLVLIDTKRKSKTELTTVDLEAAARKLTTWCRKQDDPTLKFAAKPQFRVDEADGAINFRSPVVTYAVKTADSSTTDAADVAQQYKQFSDAMVRLSIIGGPSGVPPLVRLPVNAELERRGVMPAEVSVASHDRARTVNVRSQHVFGWQLTPSDEQRIEKARMLQNVAESVPASTFFSLEDE